MNEYDINFELRYHSIEKELLDKINNGEKEYSIEDVHDICDELYCYEFLCVFKCDVFEDKRINNKINELWKKLKNDITIKNMLEILNKKKYNTNNLFNYLDNYLDDNLLLFITLFSYDTFYIIHFFIRDFLNCSLDDEKRENYLKELNIKLK